MNVQKHLPEARLAHLLTKGTLNLSFNSPVDSKGDSNVQLADFIAVSLNFKYNNKDSHYMDIIKSKIKGEKIFKWTDIKRRIVKP